MNVEPKGMRFKRKLLLVVLVLGCSSFYFGILNNNGISQQLERGASIKLVRESPSSEPRDLQAEKSSEQMTENKIKPTKNVFKEDTEFRDFVKRQNVIQQDIEDYCRNNSDSLPVFEPGFSSIVIDRVNKVTYCPIYKSASTSWAITLLTLRGEWKDGNDMNTVRNSINRVFVKVLHRNGPKETEMTTKFMIVRHPIERIVSAYRDKFEDGNKYFFYSLFGNKMVQKYRVLPKATSPAEIHKMFKIADKVLKKGKRLPLPGNPFANPYGPTFEEFVRYIINTEPNDDHWRPYYIQCSLCFMKYDFILRFENLASDSNFFIKYLDKSDVISTRWENPTAKGVTTGQISCEYFGTINLDLAKKLVQKYYHDFKLFGYSPDEYMKCIKQ